MSLLMRARAAQAVLNLMGFNPGQRRGPDGRWIKMGDSEIKSPRRARTPRAKKTAAAKTGTRPGFDAPYEQRRDALAASVASGVAGQQTLAQGVMGDTRRYELADGTSAVYKRAMKDQTGGWRRPDWTRKDQTDAEELSAVVASALGVRAPAVHRTGEDELYMELMPGQVGLDRLMAGGSISKLRSSQQGRRLGLLDVLIDNSDRNGGGYLVDDQDNLYAIDHGMAFSGTHRLDASGQLQPSPASQPEVSSPFMDGFISDSRSFTRSNPLAPSDIPKIRERLDAARPQFQQLGRMDWYEAMQRRLELLAAGANSQTPLY